MKKKLKDYKDTDIHIKVNSAKEYDALVPKLNKVWSGWQKGDFEEHSEGLGVMYIDMQYDSVDTEPNEDYEIVEASDFIEDKVNNDYSIY